MRQSPGAREEGDQLKVHQRGHLFRMGGSDERADLAEGAAQDLAGAIEIGAPWECSVDSGVKRSIRLWRVGGSERAASPRPSRARALPASLVRVLLAVGAVLALAGVVVAIRVAEPLRSAGAPTLETTLETVHRSALAFRGLHPGECPTVDRLIKERFLDSDFHAYGVCAGTLDIQCQGDDVTASCRTR